MIMKLRHFGILVLVASLFLGCSKSSSGGGAVKDVDLGTVEMSYNTPLKKDLGDKVSVTFTARPMDANSFELLAVMEGPGRKPVNTRTAPAPLNQPMQLAFGEGVTIKFVPVVK